MTITIATDPVPLHVDADGTIRVSRTRVTLDTVVNAFNLGATAEEIALRFDTLPLADVYAVIAYYLRHHSEVDAYLEQQRQETEQVRRKYQAHFDQRGIRDRLLARQQADRTPSS